jgi:hypothetical protein
MDNRDEHRLYYIETGASIVACTLLAIGAVLAPLDGRTHIPVRVRTHQSAIFPRSFATQWETYCLLV